MCSEIQEETVLIGNIIQRSGEKKKSEAQVKFHFFFIFVENKN